MFPTTSSSVGERPTRAMARTLAVALLALGFGIAGCERSQDPAVDHDHDHDHDHSAESGHDHDHEDGHDHGHDHGSGDSHTDADGADHDHDHDHDDDHDDDHSHGEVTELGVTTIGPFTVRVNRSGELAPGADVVIDLWIEDGPSTGGSRPATVRAWIGTEDAAGTVRTRLTSASSADAAPAWHEHLEAPAELADQPRLWIEIETDDGSRHRGTIAAVPGPA